MGRPPIPDEDRRKATIGVAVTEEERERYHAAARSRGIKLAEMIRQALERFLQRD